MTAKYSNYISRFQGQADILAGNLPSLLVAADRVAATVAQGVHGRRRAGQGESFWQYRAYEAEDPTHHVDWRRSARSDALYVRENEWEAAQSVWLCRGGRASGGAKAGRVHHVQGGRGGQGVHICTCIRIRTHTFTLTHIRLDRCQSLSLFRITLLETGLPSRLSLKLLTFDSITLR